METIIPSEPSSPTLPTTLNLGCGRKHLPGALNVDVTGETSPDVVHDLNVFPWPFPTNHFTEVFMYDVIEHLDNLVPVVNEICRVCRDGASVHVTVPHFSSANAFTDPTHKHFFGWHSFDYFTGEHEHSYYTRVRFETQKREMIFYPTLFNKLVWRLARRFPEEYERRWAWIFPAWYLSFLLKAVKAA